MKICWKRGCSLPLMLQTHTSRSVLQDWLMGHRWGCSTESPQRSNCLGSWHPCFVWCWRGTLTNAIVVSGTNPAGKNEMSKLEFRVLGWGWGSRGWSCNKGFWPACSACQTPHAWVLIVGWGSWGKKGVHSWASQSMILTCCSFKVWLAVLWGQRRPDLQLFCIWFCASMVLLRQCGCLTPTRKYLWEDSALSPI